jgi:hypothetical protein
MTTFQAALVREQGQKFAVVVVQYSVLNSTASKRNAQATFQPAFPGVPIILMAQDSRGVPTYYGRTDIVNFLSSIDFRRLPWAEWTVN